MRNVAAGHVFSFFGMLPWKSAIFSPRHWRVLLMTKTFGASLSLKRILAVRFFSQRIGEFCLCPKVLGISKHFGFPLFGKFCWNVQSDLQLWKEIGCGCLPQQQQFLSSRTGPSLFFFGLREQTKNSNKTAAIRCKFACVMRTSIEMLHARVCRK